MKRKRCPWVPVLGSLLAFALLGNTIFVIDLIERNRVVSVPDGDSLQLKDGRRVRLLGIDAPERGRCMADEARTKLAELAQGRHVRLKNVVTDSYGRMLAIVIVEDLPTWLGYMQKRFDPLLQRVLVSSGFARNRSSMSNPYNQVLHDAENVARSEKLGVWSDTCRGPDPASTDCTIKGNVRAGEKYYYLPECRQYPQVLVDRAFGDSWFCTEEEAMNAGFTKSAACAH